ncbi:uncharacterized protein LOC114869278 isoform X2 [Betta splendens]|uniref:Uncharacterized protein LOC114869278 isoform X2 n=1 Tax=Betta splendens TaxID=158456 RepID=A0A9W2Y7S1_BETSP|nr:uncharacterized protein LOC114869278 isoform X2 [Betta splendens]
MISIVMLLLSLIPRSSSRSRTGSMGSLVVDVTQTHYQAEQNHSITLEWTFTPKPDTITSVYIYCQLLTGLRASVLLHLHEGVEVSESQDQQFSGRVQFDRDELRDGRIRLQVSRLRTEDSGLYLCGVRTADGLGSGQCRLNVTVTDPPEAERETETNSHRPRRWISLYTGMGLMAQVALTVCFYFFINSLCRKPHLPSDPSDELVEEVSTQTQNKRF